jgi:hypothetical protein
VYATGVAKLEYRPRVEFMDLLVDECVARGLKGFDPQALANVFNGEDWHNPQSLAVHEGLFGALVLCQPSTR